MIFKTMQKMIFLVSFFPVAGLVSKSVFPPAFFRVREMSPVSIRYTPVSVAMSPKKPHVVGLRNKQQKPWGEGSTPTGQGDGTFSQKSALIFAE